MITRVFVSDPEMNKQKNRKKTASRYLNSQSSLKKTPGKYMKLSLTNSSEKIKKGDMRKKGNITSCMSSNETEDLDNDM